jgi:preprotein translocase subunit YajC
LPAGDLMDERERRIIIGLVVVGGAVLYFWDESRSTSWLIIIVVAAAAVAYFCNRLMIRQKRSAAIASLQNLLTKGVQIKLIGGPTPNVAFDKGEDLLCVLPKTTLLEARAVRTWRGGSSGPSRLADIRKTARAFWKALTAHPSGDGASEAHIYVEHVLDTILRQSMRLSVFLGPPVVPDSRIRKPRQSGGLLAALAVPDHVSESAEFVDFGYISQRLQPLKTRRVSEVLTEFVSACRLAERELEKMRDAKHYQAGEAWEMFVLRLGRFWSDLGRKTSAAKDYIKGPSPFVVFVSTIQNHFPHRFRRHAQSLDALSLKISRVLAKSRRRKRVAKRKQGGG